MTAPFYITTPIYYVNDVPHLGHAYTTIIADALARFHRMRGEPTRFLTGTDEHGQKVEQAASKLGRTPQQHVDEVAPRFVDTWRRLGITNDDFIRTTSPKHKRVVANLWRRIRERTPSDLYLATYQGWYCVGCEQFYKDSELDKVGGETLCKIHKAPVQWLDKERSWFFALSRYAEPLLAHIAAHPEFIQPEAYRNEIVAFLKGGLKDLSVSRTSITWGIPAPEPDPEGHAHVIFVWMDALTNYLSYLCPDDGSIGGPLVDEFWSRAIHVIGKDIIRFHAVYWPAFLLAAGLPLPRAIAAHGWWSVRGRKISKSIPATRVDAVQVARELGGGSDERVPLGIDALRYYLLREVPFGADGDFTLESVLGRYNAELANDLGNLVNRSLTLLHRNLEHLAPARDPHLAGTGMHAAIDQVAREVIAQTTAAYEALAPSRALEAIWRLVREANRYVDGMEPWKLAKDIARHAELAHVLHELAAVIGIIGGLVTPVLPTAGRTLRAWVGVEHVDAWPSDRDLLRIISSTHIAKDVKPLFPRFDEPTQNAIITRLLPDPAAPEPAKAPEVSFDEVSKIELRVGKVVSAAAVPKTKKLLHLHVDLGETAPRSIVAGIAEKYAPDELVGRSVIVVANLAPTTIRGVRSEGMLLAAGDDAILGLSAVDHDVPPGTRVR
jgi:methionyl-tRNA synthetase|nr:methionine--tRNA ligase [Kofleriaceae bacterium]